MQFEGEDIKLKGKIMDREFKPIWKQVNKYFKRVSEEKKTQTVKKKEMKSEIYFNQDKK